MRTSKEYIRSEWDEFFDLYKQVNEILRKKAEDLIIQDALEHWPEDHGFGSSDRWHSVFGELARTAYNEETNEWSLPTEVSEVEVTVKDYLRNRLSFYGFSKEMIECFLKDPDAFKSFVTPV